MGNHVARECPIGFNNKHNCQLVGDDVSICVNSCQKEYLECPLGYVQTFTQGNIDGMNIPNIEYCAPYVPNYRRPEIRVNSYDDKYGNIRTNERDKITIENPTRVSNSIYNTRPINATMAGVNTTTAGVNTITARPINATMAGPISATTGQIPFSTTMPLAMPSNIPTTRPGITASMIEKFGNIENFDMYDVRNTCDDACGKINLMNILIIVIILLLLYLIFKKK